MILSIGSDLPRFKSLKFRRGLNVLLSTRAEESDDGRTRNSAGKTSFVELVHFLLGADCDPSNLFRKKALVEHSFSGTFLIDSRPIRVSRTGSNANRIYIEEDVVKTLGLAAKVEKGGGATWISASEWNRYLGHVMFSLPAVLRGSNYADPYTPGFRPMFSYFARRDGSGGFAAPERCVAQQQRWDWQENLSYLLDLDWRIPRDLNKVRQRERTLVELKKAAKAGAFSHLVGSSSELRPLAVVARDKALRLRARLERFEVVESYKELSVEAASAKTEMQEVARRAVSIRENITYLRDALKDQRVPSIISVERLYDAVGAELPSAVIKRRYEQVAEFQKSVIANRRAHLTSEVTRLESELAEGDRRSATLEAERTRILTILRSGGALDDFLDLQRLLNEAEAEHATLQERLRAAETLEQETTILDIERSNIKLRLIENHRDKGSHIEEAMLLIGSTISKLYDDRSGGFEIEATDNGPEFRISIQGDDGGGISNMEIFCLDYALFTMWQKKSKGPGFLIHDSRLFEGVDPRQSLKAIELARSAAETHGGQYIVCLNSDLLEAIGPSADIVWPEVTSQPVLTDTEDGGLFGFQFG